MANTIGTNAAPGNTYADPGRYYDRAFLSRLTPQLMFPDMGTKKPLPKHSGTLIKFRRLNKITATPPMTAAAVAALQLTENTTPAAYTFGTTEVTVEPLTYGRWAQFSAELTMKDINPTMDEAKDELADDAALVLDSISRIAVDGNVTQQFAGAATSIATVAAGMTLTAAELREAVLSLRDASVPGFEKNLYKGLITPTGHFNLQSDSAVGSWIDVMKYSKPEELIRGEVGQLYGVRLAVSQNTGVSLGAGVGGINVFHAYIFGKDAFGVVDLSGERTRMFVKTPGSNDTSNPLDMFSTAGWKSMTASVVLQAPRAVQIYHAGI
ncbi:MAG: N4-gp56 family major capsid protein [Nitrospiraceae bacterium]